MIGEAWGNPRTLAMIDAVMEYDRKVGLDWDREFGSLERKIRHDGGYRIVWRDAKTKRSGRESESVSNPHPAVRHDTQSTSG